MPSLISGGGTKWVTNMVIDKSRRQKYRQKPSRFTANAHMKMCISDLLQRLKNKV